MIFSVDIKQNEKLEKHLKNVSSDIEKDLNDFLHTTSAKRVMQQIINFMPVSDRRKKHARDSSPLKIEEKNLGFSVYAKGGAANKPGSYGYLVFPNEGRGVHNRKAQEFFERGMNKEKDRIFEDVEKILLKRLEIKD